MAPYGTGLPASSRQGAVYPSPSSITAGSNILRLDIHAVINCDAQFLFAAQVTLGCLDRDVSEQELDLIEFATGKMTEPGATPPEVMRRKLFYARL